MTNEGLLSSLLQEEFISKKYKEEEAQEISFNAREGDLVKDSTSGGKSFKSRTRNEGMERSQR